MSGCTHQVRTPVCVELPSQSGTWQPMDRGRGLSLQDFSNWRDTRDLLHRLPAFHLQVWPYPTWTFPVLLLGLNQTIHQMFGKWFQQHWKVKMPLLAADGAFFVKMFACFLSASAIKVSLWARQNSWYCSPSEPWIASVHCIITINNIIISIPPSRSLGRLSSYLAPL